MELLDNVTMRALNASGYLDEELPEKPVIVLKLAGHTSDDVHKQAVTAFETATSAQALGFRVGQDAEEGATLWAARTTALWSALALKHSPDDKFLAADACIPVPKLGEIIERTHAMLEESGLFGCSVGHVGDGNFNTMVTFSADEEKKASKIISATQKQSVNLEGTVTGEHGIDLEFRDQIVYELGEGPVDAMRQVESTLDPLGLMDPGKMVRIERP
jgi:D-lactate dehydrogenase (cytochrome)